jgi:antitoxin component YwqK of YwqJK toxin-antitoxin module
MKRFRHTIIFLFLYSRLAAQSDTTFYNFDENLEEVAAKKATYTAKGWLENGKTRMIYYEKATGLPLMEGYYLDKNRKVKDGLFIYYDEKGNEGIKGIFVQGKEDGYWLYWTKGYLTDSVLFDNGKDLVRTSYTFYDNGLLKSRISNDSRNKSTEIMLIDANGNLERLTKWVQGTGDQTYYYPNGKIRSIEHYKDKVLSSIDYFHADGTPLSKKDSKKEKENQTENSWKKIRDGSPIFPGGEVGFREQFQKHFRTPPGVANDIRNAVLIRIMFDLDKDGRAINIRLMESATIELNRSVEMAFRNMPAWDMKGLLSYGPIQYTISITGN